MMNMLLVAAIATSLDYGVLEELSPELDAFTEKDIKLRTGRFHVFTSKLWRDDKASLSIVTSAFESSAHRKETVNAGWQDNMARPPRPGSDLERQIHTTLTGVPVGDTVWTFEDPESKSIMFSIGAETVQCSMQFYYYRSIVNGEIVYVFGNHAADRVLIEDIARRVLGRALAYERFPSVRGATLPTNATEATDTSGKVYVSLSHWATGQSLATSVERRVGLRFTYHGKAVQVWTGTDKIKVGSEWKPIGAYVVEINNKLFVPKSGFLAALP